MIIDVPLYDEILKTMPILCVDVVLIRDKKVLLMFRKNEPAKDTWWFPGGRVFKNETLEETIIRKLKEEVNIENFSIYKQLTITETDFETGPRNIPVHTINVTFLINSFEGDISIDDTHSDYQWFSEKQNNFHPEVCRVFDLLKQKEII
jgi:colanic acid biosynthesis protein WcaH